MNKAALNKFHVFCQKKSKRYEGARKKPTKRKVKKQTFTYKIRDQIHFYKVITIFDL